ncbi:hypothetical protein JOD24_000262 [Kroppenstedtia sanguinis]
MFLSNYYLYSPFPVFETSIYDFLSKFFSIEGDFKSFSIYTSKWMSQCSEKT